MVVMRLGVEFTTYSTKLNKVVSRVNGRKGTLEHRDKVGTRDRTQGSVVINGSYRVMEGQAREFYREGSQSFARSSSSGQQMGKESINEVMKVMVRAYFGGKRQVAISITCWRYCHSI